MLWILLAVIAVLGGGALAYRAGKRRGAAGELPAGPGTRALLERTARDVRVDDVLQHGGKDWLVEGVVSYDEDGHAWRSARGLDTPEERWFVVGFDRVGPPTIRVCKRVTIDLQGYPAEELAVDGKSFRLAQRGNATAVLSGTFPDLPGAAAAVKDMSLRCRFWRYATGTGETLLIEQWGDTYRALVGETVAIDRIDLLAGS
jgi:hypothetical protein